MEAFDAIIIGGGPAGLFASIMHASASGVPKKTLLLERNESPGRKLLLSGSGQCNISHAGSVEELLRHYCGGAKTESAYRFLKPALYNFSNQDLLTWFGEKGIDFEIEEGGKIFPSNRKAKEIVKVLIDECSVLNVCIRSNRRVMKIQKSEGHFVVDVEVDDQIEEYKAVCLLISTGGTSYPMTGSTGDGYIVAKALGHTIIKPRPSLSPVSIDSFSMSGLAGQSFNAAELTVRRDSRKLHTSRGDLLITHKGFSGPLILDSSRYIEPGDMLEIKFSELSLTEFSKQFNKALDENPRKLVRSTYACMGLPKRMAELFCDIARISEAETASHSTRTSRNTLCRLACAHEFKVGSIGSFESAMATAGGVDIAEINPKTMESRIVPGLFFAGEVLDIDGDTGGYNLQAAFSTGACAGQSMALAHGRGSCRNVD